MKRILSELISCSMLDTTAPYILHRALKAVTFSEIPWTFYQK